MLSWKIYRRPWFWVLLLAVLVVSIGLVCRNAAVRSLQQATLNTLSLEKLPDLPKLQVGDVILRCGVGADSLMIASVSQSLYSHSGIVFATEPEVLIVHATTADDAGIAAYQTYQDTLQRPHPTASAPAAPAAQSDPSAPSADSTPSANILPSGQVVLMPLRFFVEQATHIAVLRYPELQAHDYPRLQASLQGFVGKPFSLDSKDPDSVYCTTLIEQALSPLVTTSLKRQDVKLMIVQGEYLFPEAFLHDPHAQLIYQYPPVTAESQDGAGVAAGTGTGAGTGTEAGTGAAANK